MTCVLQGRSRSLKGLKGDMLTLGNTWWVPVQEGKKEVGRQGGQGYRPHLANFNANMLFQTVKLRCYMKTARPQ